MLQVLQKHATKATTSVFDESQSAEGGNNFDNARIKKNKEYFNKLRYGFSKSKIKDIKKNRYGIKKPKKSF